MEYYQKVSKTSKIYLSATYQSNKAALAIPFI